LDVRTEIGTPASSHASKNLKKMEIGVV